MLANPSILTGLNMMLVLLVSQPTLFLATDVDQVDMESDTSGMGDVYDIEEIGDPNLTNPQRGQNYGPPLNPNTPPNRSSGSSPTTDPNTKESFSEQTIGALLELGIIVSGTKEVLNGQDLFDGSSEKYLLTCDFQNPVRSKCL